MDAPIHAISRLLQPRSVAIIGASADPAKTAGRPVAYLQKHGFAGRILPELEATLAASERLRNLHGFIGHGLHDSKLPVTWAARADAWLTQLGVAHTTRLYPVDHTLSAEMRADFEAWYRPLLAPPS